MALRYDRSPAAGPNMVDLQINTGIGFLSIFTDSTVDSNAENNNGIILSAFTGITKTITFRLYAYGATSGLETYDIEEHTNHIGTKKGIIINGTVLVVPLCDSMVTTWNGPIRQWDNGNPNIYTNVVINDGYDTFSKGSFSACSLVINSGFTLCVDNDAFVEAQNNVTVDGLLSVETHGNFVQNSDSSVFSNNGNSVVRKSTATLDSWVDYTYWSSPING